MKKILDFWNRFKIPILAVVAVWGFIGFVQYYAISPLVQQNAELKQDIKAREKENKLLSRQFTKDSILLVESEKRVEELEKKEQEFKELIPKIIIKYEKQKTDFISRPLSERRRIFSELANE